MSENKIFNTLMYICIAGFGGTIFLPDFSIGYSVVASLIACGFICLFNHVDRYEPDVNVYIILRNTGIAFATGIGSALLLLLIILASNF